MGWSLGWDGSRFIGYGVIAYCDTPGCFNEIDRGLGYKCEAKDVSFWDEEDEEMSHKEGCGGFFCSEHRGLDLCDDCDLSFNFTGWGLITRKNTQYGLSMY